MSRVSSNDCAKGCVAIFEDQGRLRESGCDLEYLATNLQQLEAERGGWEVVRQDDGLCDGDLTGGSDARSSAKSQTSASLLTSR